METNIKLDVDPPEITKFDPAWDEKTVQAAFDESAALYGRLPEWADAIDKKVITVFTLATGIGGVASAFQPWHADSVGSLVCLIVALAALVGAVIACAVSYWPHDFSFGPLPKQLIAGDWFGRPLSDYQFHRMRRMGQSIERNRDQINIKARRLTYAMIGTGVEVLALWSAHLF
jgi:hypothetical protein